MGLFFSVSIPQVVSVETHSDRSSIAGLDTNQQHIGSQW